MSEENTQKDDVWSVLIVDDDRISSTVLQKLLEVEGYQVTVTGDGEKAWEMIQEQHFSLVLMDRDIPGIDGLQVCKNIRQRENMAYVYIILLTEMTEKKEMIESLDAGADDYLAKPYDYVELIARLNSARRILDLERTLQNKNEELKRIALNDTLTTAKNRAAYESQIEPELKRAARYHHALSVVLCDIENFKHVNDQHGHISGDKVLVELVRRINSVIRIDIDSVYRYAGELFVILLPETGPENAQILASRIQYVVEGIPFEIADALVDVSLNFGVAGYEKNSEPDVTMDSKLLFQSADDYLLQAKTAQQQSIQAGEVKIVT